MDNIADHYGEKLNEAFVAACMKTVFDRHGIAPKFAMIALDESGNAAAYTLYVEFTSKLPDTLGPDLDMELRRNPHYDLCVRLGQLRPVQVFTVATRAYETYSQVLVKRGMRLGDIKPTVLSRLTDWSGHFARCDNG